MKSRMVKYVSLLMGALGVFGNSYCFGGKVKMVRNKFCLDKRVDNYGEAFSNDIDPEFEKCKKFLVGCGVCWSLLEIGMGVINLFDKFTCDRIKSETVSKIPNDEKIIDKEEAKKFVNGMRFQTISKFYCEVEESIGKGDHLLGLCEVFFGNTDIENFSTYVVEFADACISTGVFSISDSGPKYCGNLGCPLDILTFTPFRNYGLNTYNYADVVNNWYNKGRERMEKSFMRLEMLIGKYKK